MAEQPAPVRKWYYLGGEFRDTDGKRTTDPGEARFPPEAWFAYDPEVSFQLSESYESLIRQGERGDTRLLDISMFSEPPLPYEIWQGRKVVVRNPSATSRLIGKSVVGGFRGDIWTRLADRPEMLPKCAAQWVDMGVATIVGGFYQIHREHLGNLAQLLSFLEDPDGLAHAPAVEPRKRLVMMIEFPGGWHDVRRALEPTGQDVAALEDGDPPVYEWWYGDRFPESECVGKQLRGFWRRYHPTVCRRIEAAWQHMAGFQDCSIAADVDGVRYMMHRVVPNKPFDYSGREGRGALFQEAMCLSIDYPCYEELDRVTGNCLVQFRKENANRRRPARRRVNAEEIARNAARTGEPCCICFSEPGELTGCAQLHVICGGCLRAALRSMAGDITILDNLVCGCFSHLSRGAVTVLAERADRQLGDVLAAPPMEGFEKMLLDDELQSCRRQFDLGVDESVPTSLYATKIREWFNKVIEQQILPNYYVCSHPDCAHEVENWILRTEFDTEYRSRGKKEWHCPLGHRNTVLPMETEIREVNKVLLLHPEYYINSAAYDRCPLRRYRICKGCVECGILMLAVHADGCKQWPGGTSAHQHCFCFSCTGTWGMECNHGNQCSDPGIQQVRLGEGSLEIGFIDGQEYIRWLHGERSDPPDTVFSAEPCVADGTARQRELQMEDREGLLQESQTGTR